MVRIIIALVSILVLGSIGAHKQTDAWETACAFYGQETGNLEACAELRRPRVRITNPMDGLVNGYFKGGDTIWINENLRGKEKRSVVIHEMSHYIDQHLGLLTLPGPLQEVCASEDRAWAVSDRYLTSVGISLPELAWWVDYPHCWEFYAT